MFKDLIETRKRTALLFDALQEVINMLERAERMFGVATGMLLTEQDTVVDIDQEDRELNAGERMTRRMVLEHLVINPDQDLPGSLALISIVHDVERLGDYAKSLIELNQWQNLASGEGPYPEMCRRLYKAIAPLFGQTLEALREGDAQMARQVMHQHEEIKKQTDEFIAAVMEDAQSSREAVLYALASRFLRRTSAHLSNVASGIANPLDRVSGKDVG